MKRDMETSPLVLKQFGGVIEVTPDAWTARDRALEIARPISQVITPEQQIEAVEALRQLKALRVGMEATRKSVKAPVLELGRKIDQVAADYIELVLKQEGRLQGMINHFQRKQLEEKRDEEQKIEQEARHAAELEAEAQKLRHEAVFQVDLSVKREMLAKAAELEKAAVDARLTAEVLMQPPEIAKTKGLVVRNRVNFQVTDPIVFCQAYPDFWKWNAETETLKLDRQRVLDELNKERGVFHRTRFPEELPAGDNDRLVRPAGLRVFEETKTHIR